MTRLITAEPVLAKLVVEYAAYLVDVCCTSIGQVSLKEVGAVLPRHAVEKREAIGIKGAGDTEPRKLD